MKIVFVGFCVMKTTELEAFDRALGSDSVPQSLIVETAGVAPSHLSLSCDDLTLAILMRKDGKCYVLFYEVASFKVSLI